ncbi:metal dependent phosphohydrolases like protein [Ralstonia phage phiRSL1]|uniref:Metal dependent phosphohydrolases like protein n=1 Tax=Ralstonia phage phiRSL1 TaxID=1980924 RepID=B2ZXQ9_9CAUD|nr:phosphohydrolase [Ralstonia phage phiRSL1]BAG41490.1 metal dependent phosphohydrolases like protein [Ralstonia phage phiRSL1]
MSTLEYAKHLALEHAPDAYNFMMLQAQHMNPYHNSDHCLLVGYHAWAAASYDHASYALRKMALVAGLLHDIGHSGGQHADVSNVGYALERISKELRSERGSTLVLSNYQNVVKEAIRCTMYDAVQKKFPVEPSHDLGRWLRDADLCMIYTPEGRRLLDGLALEVTPADRHPLQWTAHMAGEWVAQNEVFLLRQTMFSPYGKDLRNDHISAATRAYLYESADRVAREWNQPVASVRVDLFQAFATKKEAMSAEWRAALNAATSFGDQNDQA